jgi:hypothetical protein
VVDVAVDAVGGEHALRVLLDGQHHEPRRRAVQPVDLDLVAPPQVGEVDEHSRTAVPVDVRGDDRRSEPSRRRTAGEPAGHGNDRDRGEDRGDEDGAGAHRAGAPGCGSAVVTAVFR